MEKKYKSGKQSFGAKKTERMNLAITEYSKELAFFISQETQKSYAIIFEELILKEAKRIAKRKNIPLPENTEE